MSLPSEVVVAGSGEYEPGDVTEQGGRQSDVVACAACDEPVLILPVEPDFVFAEDGVFLRGEVIEEGASRDADVIAEFLDRETRQASVGRECACV